MPQKPGHGNPNRPDAPTVDAPISPPPGPTTVEISPAVPNYGDTLVVGYSPASPVLTGVTAHLTVTSTPDTQTDTDILGPGQIILDEHKSVATGTAAQRTIFVLSGDTEWSGGGADGNVDLATADGHVFASATFTILG